MNYTELLAQIQTEIESDEDDFVADIPNQVKRAEERILRKAQLPNFRKNSTGTTTTGIAYLSTPAGFLSPYSLALMVAGTYTYVDFMDVSMLREAFPDSTATGTPRLYAMFDDDTLMMAPTPDSTIDVELHYFYRPETIVTAGTSWLGDNAETALFYGSLIEAAIFSKSEQEVLAAYTASFGDAMADLKVLAEGYNKTDSYRAGEVRTQRR